MLGFDTGIDYITPDFFIKRGYEAEVHLEVYEGSCGYAIITQQLHSIYFNQH